MPDYECSNEFCAKIFHLDKDIPWATCPECNHPSYPVVVETDVEADLRARIEEVEKERDIAQGLVTSYEEYYGRVMSEQCAPDEKHCTCVPALRQRIASMERELLGVKRIVELVYENRLAIPGMLRAINDYEDALKG